MSTLKRLGSIFAALAAVAFLTSPSIAAYNAILHGGAGGQPVGEFVSQTAPNQSHTGDTTETVLANIKIPAGLVGPNDRVIVRTYWSFTGTAGTKTTKVYWNTTAAAGGTAYLSAAGASTDLSGAYNTYIMANNATNAQIGGLTTGVPGGRSSGAAPTGTIDTTADSYIVITGTLGSAADTVTLAGVQVEVLKNN